MGKSLTSKRIVITGSRKTDEMSLLIQKQGGIPLIRSLQGTIFFAEQELEGDLQRVLEAGVDWFVFTTGAGTEALLEFAEKLGIHGSFLHAMEQSKIAARGYKTLGALKKLSIQPDVVDEDGTVQGLIRALEEVDITGQRVVVQLHGEPAPVLIDFLKSKGAFVTQLLPYQHIPPKEEVVEALCSELMDGQLDTVCFTTAVQVRNLFHYARKHGIDMQIQEVFEQKTLAAAVGKVTGEALREEGIKRLFVAANERMGAMIVELAKYYESSE
jgi:uroporphyrinogen-III synthase